VSGAEPTTLLPPLTQFDVEIVITDFLFLKLAAIGDELNTVDPGTFAPRLARQWTFEDSLTIRFALDPAARWHDGRPVTGADVVFTFDVYRDTLVNALARQCLGILWAMGRFASPDG
jgi:peptide/nickel transport system substrate-binding protein